MEATENTDKLDNLIDELEQSNVNKRQRNILLVLILVILAAFIAYLFHSENSKKATASNTTQLSTTNNINTPPHKNEGIDNSDVEKYFNSPNSLLWNRDYGKKELTTTSKENIDEKLCKK